MGNLLLDVKYGFRILVKSPGFTLIAVLTLALGIGANTAIFSVVNGVLLRPLSYPHGERIVEISRTFRHELEPSNFTANQFAFWKGHGEPFQYLAATTSMGFNLSGESRPERVRALRVSSEYFHVLGVQPALGRDFLGEEDSAGGPNVTILSHGVWTRDLGADPQVLGKSVLLDGQAFTVVGVMPAGFEGLPQADLWTTIAQVAKSIGSGTNFEVIGRLKPEVSRARADSYLGTQSKPFLSEFARKMSDKQAKDTSFAVFPYSYVNTNDVRTPLLVLFAAIGFVLLIACANVANLQLARATTRTREIAVRTALGAGRRRIILQLLTENILLALVGGSVGLLVAPWMLSFFLALTPPDLTPAQVIGLDARALAFTVLAAVLAGVLFGLAPAWQVCRTDLNESLKESGGRASAGRRRGRVAALLAAGEVALSMVLLVGSGLLIKTFANLLRTDPGFDPHPILSLQIWITGSQYKSSAALAGMYDRLVEKIQSIPGVENAAVVAAGLPLERGGNVAVRIENRKDLDWLSVDYREITPGYFSTLGVRLLQGRGISKSDSEATNKVIVINSTFARQYFPGRDPIGQHLVGGDANGEIIGVVGDVKSSLNEQAPPTIFIPLAQAEMGTDQLFQGWYPTTILVKAAVNPASLSHAVETAVQDVDPNLPIGKIRSLDEVLSISLAFQRFLMTLMSLFAGLAMLLAAIGLYGVISYSVNQRRHEIGIRMALGATRNGVLGMIVRQGLTLALVGAAAGLAGALAVTRILGNMLYGVTPNDPPTFAATALLLMLVAFLASYLPARRATKVDPMVALRYE
jgi:predicted permease